MIQSAVYKDGKLEEGPRSETVWVAYGTIHSPRRLPTRHWNRCCESWNCAVANASWEAPAMVTKSVPGFSCTASASGNSGTDLHAKRNLKTIESHLLNSAPKRLQSPTPLSASTWPGRSGL